MSKAGKPSSRRLKEVPRHKAADNRWLLWFELFGHGLVVIVAIGLLTGRIISWLAILLYIAIQVAVMIKDGFERWHAWPFIVSDWRKYGIGKHA